jgi:hypothetical protein
LGRAISQVIFEVSIKVSWKYLRHLTRIRRSQCPNIFTIKPLESRLVRICVLLRVLLSAEAHEAKVAGGPVAPGADARIRDLGHVLEMLAQPLVGKVLRQALDAQARVPGARHLHAVRSGGVGQGSEDEVRYRRRAAKSERSMAAETNHIDGRTCTISGADIDHIEPPIKRI